MINRLKTELKNMTEFEISLQFTKYFYCSCKPFILLFGIGVIFLDLAFIYFVYCTAPFLLLPLAVLLMFVAFYIKDTKEERKPS